MWTDVNAVTASAYKRKFDGKYLAGKHCIPQAVCEMYSNETTMEYKKSVL